MNHASSSLSTDIDYATAEKPIVLTGQADGGEAFYRYYRDHRGFDAAVKGHWQERYAGMIDQVFGLPGRRVLDLGCAMGGLTLALAQRGADIWGVEINRYMVSETPFTAIRGRILLGEVPDILRIFAANLFDFVHASQILEHIVPDRQGAVMAQLHRVLRPGGLLFAAMPMDVGTDHVTTDASTGLSTGIDDVTHVCIKSRDWWQSLQGSLFRDADPLYESLLSSQPMFQEYRWEHVIWQAVA